jgi:hypothetical protein
VARIAARVFDGGRELLYTPVAVSTPFDHRSNSLKVVLKKDYFHRARIVSGFFRN